MMSLGGTGRESGTQKGNGRAEEGGEEVNQNNKQLFFCRHYLRPKLSVINEVIVYKIIYKHTQFHSCKQTYNCIHTVHTTQFYSHAKTEKQQGLYRPVLNTGFPLNSIIVKGKLRSIEQCIGKNTTHTTRPITKMKTNTHTLK